MVKEKFKKINKDLDASWYLPNINRNPKKEFMQKRIPKAVFFDIDDVCDNSSSYRICYQVREHLKTNI